MSKQSGLLTLHDNRFNNNDRGVRAENTVQIPAHAGSELESAQMENTVARSWEKGLFEQAMRFFLLQSPRETHTGVEI